jgi:hypothetical protein
VSGRGIEEEQSTGEGEGKVAGHAAYIGQRVLTQDHHLHSLPPAPLFGLWTFPLGLVRFSLFFDKISHFFFGTKITGDF